MQEILQKFSVRELRMSLLGLGIVLIAGLIVATLLPNFKAMLAANRVVVTLNAAAQDGGRLEQHLKAKNQELEDLQFRLYGDMANLPEKQVEAYIIGRLQEISWRTRVELVSVEPAAGKQLQIFQEMLFNVQLVGQYRDLYRWLWDVRNELGYVVINEYSLKRNDDDDSEPELLARLSLASYRAIQ